MANIRDYPVMFFLGRSHNVLSSLTANNNYIFLLVQIMLQVTFSKSIQEIRYVTNPSLVNKVCSSQSRLFVITAKSKVDCIQMCTQYVDCVSFFYKASTKVCTGCSHIFKDTTCGLDNSNGNVYYHEHTLEVPGEDCLSIKQATPTATSGTYTVTLTTGRTISVYCDMDTNGGGWTVFQYRDSGNLDFYRGFEEYTDGFGDTNSEFWLGLQNIHEMAPPDVSSELYLFLEDATGTTKVETASTFALGDYPCFKITLTGGGSDLTYNNNGEFSTYDYGPKKYCATQRHSGWWHRGCTWINPNGRYVTPGTSDGWSGVVHVPWKNFHSMAITKIMFRRN